MLIKNALIATASDVYKGDIYIRDGIISQIGENIDIEEKEAGEIIDAEGNYVIPGGIDVHTHFSLDVGIAVSNDDFRTGTIAAACGGTTSIVDHIGQGPEGSTLRDRIEHYHGLAGGKAVIDYSFHGVIAYDADDRKLKDMEELIKEGIESYKIYMTYGQRIDDNEAIKVLKTAKDNNAIVSVHPENHDTIEYLKTYYVENGMTSPIYHAKSRPEECEAEAINRIISIAHLVGDAPIYIVHLSSNMGLDYIKMARKRGQKNIFVETCTQYLVLDEEKYNLPDEPILLYCGQMNWKKNIQRILESCACYAQSGKPFTLVLAGQGPDVKSIHQKVDELGLTDRVRFTGHVTGEQDLYGLYENADLFVFPSLYDTSGMVVREAAAMGTPSVVVRGCATAEPIIDRQNGFLCDDTTQSLCDVLNMTLSDHAMTKEVGKSARKTIYLSWDDIASSTVERYQALIERNTKSPKIL